MLTCMEIPEKAQAEALQRLADLGRRRADLLQEAKELLPQIKEAALEADRLGASRSRAQQLSRISSSTFYKWLPAEQSSGNRRSKA
ncbi:hypothetical protein AB0L74_34500 [Streptomyces sp. NPDC052020]|uniref:hypothetical protein n=1 Tax=Streptomyces sp. NPDC052020 TaxID=3155677 RepID=UPI00344657C5